MNKIRKLLLRLGLVLLALLFAIVLWRNVMFRGPAKPIESLPENGVIDMHVHLAGIGSGGSGCFVSKDIRDSFKFSIYLKSFFVTVARVEKEGDQILPEQISKKISESKHVSGAVVLALDGVIDKEGNLDKTKTEIFVPNSFARDAAQKYSNLHFGASINPYRKDAIQRLETVAKEGAVLIKWLPNIQFIDPADENITAFYKKLVELKLPLLTHTGQERSFTHSNDEYGDPKRLELPLKLGVTVIAAHCATTGKNEGEDNTSRLLPMFEKYPNLYSDISSLTQINKLGYLERILKDERTKGRLVYGSDFPLINMIIVSPFYFPLNLTLKQIFTIRKIPNVWDRDARLKQALGVPKDIFARSGKLLGIE